MSLSLSKWLIMLCLSVSLVSAKTTETESLGQRWRSVLQGKVPHETAIGGFAGMAYDWTGMGFGLFSWQHFYQYSDIWIHDAPEGLGIRFEGTLGAARTEDTSRGRLMTSGNFLAVYEFPEQTKKGTRFYAEAGIGLIYTDFQRPDQGLRINFNPVAGIGWRIGKGFVTLRLHHVSNGGLHRENRGINSVLLGMGCYIQ